MKKIVSMFLLIAAGFCLAACNAPAPADASEDQSAIPDSAKIAVVVNSENIYENEVIAEYELLLAISEENRKIVNSSDISDELKKEMTSRILVPTKEEILSDLIESRLLTQEAEKRNLVPTDAELDDYFAQVDKGLEAAPEEDVSNVMSTINEYREGLGMSEQEYHQRQREVIKEAMMRDKLRNQLNLTDSDMDSYLADLKASAVISYANADDESG